MHCKGPFILFSVRVDQAGVICQQDGIFRVNCMDCLDRTNVVQAAVARAVMEQQVRSVPEACGRQNVMVCICRELDGLLSCFNGNSKPTLASM